MTVDVSVPLAAGATTTTHYGSESPTGALLLLAHGAGAGHRHPFIVGIAGALADRGIDVLTFNFPYMEQRRRLPDRAPVLEACFRSVVEFAMVNDAFKDRRLYIGGKSMGGRMATHLAAEGMADVDGVVVLGYPLHPPGKPDRARTAHLPAIRVPVLIVQGERDVFGTPDELQPVLETMTADVSLHVVEGGDHSLTVKGAAREAVTAQVADVVTEWLATRHAQSSAP